MRFECTRLFKIDQWAHSFLTTHYTSLLKYHIKTLILSPLSETGTVPIHHQSPVSNPIEESSSKDRFMEYFDPLGEHQIRCDDGAGGFMAGRKYLEQQFSTRKVNGHISHLIKDQHLLGHPRVTFIEGSITDLDLLMETFPGADGIFHQAAIPSVKNPLASNEANVTGTVSVLVAAKDCGVPALLAPPRVIAK